MMSQLLDLVDGLVFDDLGSERAFPLQPLLVSRRQAMDGFNAKHDKVDAVLAELVATNGEGGNAPGLVAALRTLTDLQLWVGREGAERPVWLLGLAEDGQRVGLKTAVLWT